jgi:2-dehydropantoate 2-reductase
LTARASGSETVKLCVVGAGAIGGYLAVGLAKACDNVSVVIRGANLQAVRANGLKVVMSDGSEQVARVAATDHLDELGEQDIVFLALKAHQLAPVMPQIGALIGPQTLVVTAQNGVPWWYFFKHGGPYEGQRIEAVDPGGAISDALPVDRTIGCIVYPACELAAPGVIRHIEGNRFTLGEIDGAETERVRRLAQLLRDAGFKAPVVSDIRAEIWLKLWGNVSFNPISALTHATLEDICRFPETRALAAAMMTEAQAIGTRLGVPFKISLDKRIAGAEAVGAHKTSMLQDVESGRVLELDALVKSVIELGRITGTPTPTIDHVYALAALLARTLAQQSGRLRVTPV